MSACDPKRTSGRSLSNLWLFQMSSRDIPIPGVGALVHHKKTHLHGIVVIEFASRYVVDQPALTFIAPPLQ